MGPAEPAFRARQIYTALYRNHLRDWSEVTTLTLEQRRALAANLAFGLPGVAAQYDSTDGTRRYLLTLHDGRTAEPRALYNAELDSTDSVRIILWSL